MSQNSASLHRDGEDLRKALRRIMDDIHAACVENGEGEGGRVDYVKGANLAGFEKVADAMLARRRLRAQPGSSSATGPDAPASPPALLEEPCDATRGDPRSTPGGRSPQDATMAPELGQRIMILGCAGSGKSTLARSIGRGLALPVHHLDQLFWQPGWRESDRAVFDAAVVALAEQPRWVIDGNYLRTAEVRVRSADTVIWLDLPLSVCLARVLWRMLRDYGRTRDDMPAGCPEHFDPVFLAWIWNFRRDTRPRILHLLAAAESGPAVIRLASRRAVARLMAGTAT